VRPARGDARHAARDGGYALLAAVAAVAAFAYVAFQVMASGQGGMAMIGGQVERARLASAANAGIYLALHGLAVNDPDARWAVDGRQRSETFEGVNLTIVVEDERGKVPLNRLTDRQARALFAGAGADTHRADALTAEYRAWEAMRPINRQASPPPADPDQPGRRGPFATVGELSVLKDMDATLWAHIAPVVTVFFGQSGPFEPSEAKPLAIATMNANATTDNPLISFADQVAPPAPDEDIAGTDDHLYGRALTVRVTARAGDGAVTHRMAIVELTGDPDQPYWVRYAE
jgi:general secretion pathway protein K